MTIDQQLDRAERCLRLMLKSDRKERNRMRELDEKISILIAAQIRNAERWHEFGQTDPKSKERLSELKETQRKWQEKMRRRWGNDSHDS